MVKDWNTLEPTGNPAFDMVANCVFEHRKKRIPIKTIYLNPRAYSMFEDYIKREKEKIKEFVEAGTKYQFDGVDVEKDFLQGAYIRAEYYPMKTHAEA